MEKLKIESVFGHGVRFECLADCSTCCRISGGFVYLSEKEAWKIAGFLLTDFNEFRAYFTKEIDGRLVLADGEGDG